jgi:hypothetical protein
VAEGKVLGGTVVFDMLVSYGASTNRRPNAAYVQAAVEHALGKVDFTQGRRLQLGESVAQPIKSVVVEKLEGASLDYSDTFRITVEGFGPLLQRISSVIRTFDFLKSVADKLRADGRTSVNRATNAYSPVRVEGRGWSSDAAGKPIPNLAPSDDGTTFLYRPEIEYALNNATVLPPPDNVGVPGLDFEEGGESNQSVADEAVPGWGVLLIVLLLLCFLSPLLCYLYAHFKYGAGKEVKWFKYKLSHSDPVWPFGYVPREDRDALRASLYEEKKPIATLDESTAEDQTSPESRI